MPRWIFTMDKGLEDVTTEGEALDNTIQDLRIFRKVEPWLCFLSAK